MTFCKHRKFRDICLEVLGPVRLFDQKAVFKARYWNLGQAGVAFPIEAEVHKEEIYGGLDDYIFVEAEPRGLREAFEKHGKPK